MQSMDPISGLMHIGLTEYEARVYLALLKQPEVSGYEVSRVSGVPRSKVYETLEGLQRKGAATVLSVDGKQTYQPLPHELLLERHQRHTVKVVADLSSALNQISNEQVHGTITSLSGYNPVMQRVKELCRSSAVRLLIAGFPADLEQLAPELAQAEQNGSKIFVLSYGECSLNIKNVIVHTVSPLQYLQVTVIGRWLGVVSDYNQAILAIVGAETLGIWGSNKGWIYAISLWIQHDIQAMELVRYLGAEEMGKIPPEALQRLKEMTLIQPEEMKTVHKQENVSARQLLKEIAERMAANSLAYSPACGEYGFSLQGEDGGEFTLRVDSSGVTLREGIDSPGLIVKISDSDFVALVRGTLPLIAFMEEGRITVKGDLGLAGNLQQILRG